MGYVEGGDAKGWAVLTVFYRVVLLVCVEFCCYSRIAVFASRMKCPESVVPFLLHMS